MIRALFSQCQSCRVPKIHFSTLIKINEVPKFTVDQHIEVKGWVKSLRKMKGNVFVDISDGSSCQPLQVVIEKSSLPQDLSFGSSVEVVGRLSINHNNQYELLSDSVKVVGPCPQEGFPFAHKKTYSDEYLRQFLHFRPRTNRFSSLLRIRHLARSKVNNFFGENGFFHIDTPILSSNDCEGAGEVFKVLPDNELLMPNQKLSDDTYFDVKTFLSVSGQLHLEIISRSLSHVYSFGPTFRAENSKSRLHLSEFYMIEAESTYFHSIPELLKFLEKLIKNVTSGLVGNHMNEIQNYNKHDNDMKQASLNNIESIISNDFIILSYEEACDALVKNKVYSGSEFISGLALTKEQELFLVKHCGNIPVFVVDWPADLKPFYMKNSPKRDNHVMAFDLLCPIVGEVCGGSVRESDYSVLEDRLSRLGLSEKLNWYLELRKYGNVTTGGFGIGFERFLQVILATPNIKDTLPFPRWPHNCSL